MPSTSVSPSRSARQPETMIGWSSTIRTRTDLTLLPTAPQRERHRSPALTPAGAKSTVEGKKRRQTDVAFNLLAQPAQSHFCFPVRALARGQCDPRCLAGKRKISRRNTKRDAADEGLRRNKS